MATSTSDEINRSLAEQAETRPQCRFRYYILDTTVDKQVVLRSSLMRTLPSDHGVVFYPCMEAYRRDAGGKIVVKALFPGYMFIRSDLDLVTMHEFIAKNRFFVSAIIRELGLGERKAAGEQTQLIGDSMDFDFRLDDVSEEESRFLDFLLGIDESGGNLSKEADEQVKRRNLPTQGILRMSYGYREGNRYVVMKGPLRAYENHIAKVNRHDRKAYLDIKINGKPVKAGFEVKPKRYWFPDDSDAPVVLADGQTEVDVEALARSMMKLK